MVFAFLAPLAPAAIPAAQAAAVLAGTYLFGEQVIKPIFTPKAVEAEKLAQLPAESQKIVAQKTDVSTILLLVGGALVVFWLVAKK